MTVRGPAADGTRSRLEVEDHGVGIPARDLDRIFERFYRVDQGRSRDTGGTGLGLSIVRHVAANHQGRVEVDSREGEGSTFRSSCPPSPSARSEQPPRTADQTPTPTDSDPTRPAWPRPTVLLAEDEESFVDALVIGLTVRAST